MINIRLGVKKDIPKINELYKSVIKDLKEVKQIDMLWGDVYPFCEVEHDINSKDMYVIESKNTIIGSFVLSDFDDPDYHNIDWTKNKRFIYLNRLVINPNNQGQGYAKEALKYIEKEATNMGYEIIRLTVYEDNIWAIKLYEKFGFKKIKNGNWQLENKIFKGYEKILNS